VLQAIIGGQTCPEELVKLVHGRTLNKHGRDIVKDAVTASFSKTDLTVFKQLKETIDLVGRQIEECQKELTALCKEHFPKQYERLHVNPCFRNDCRGRGVPLHPGIGLKTFVLFGKVFLAKCRQFFLAFFYLTPNEVYRLF
jgi:hypothetical protein